MYTLHYAPDNASMIVRLVLEGAEIPHSLALMDRANRQQDSAAYRRLNPAGLIPTLITDHGPIAETGAILLWLADRHGLIPPIDAPDRQTLLHWLFYLSNTPHTDLRALFYPHLYVPAEATAGHHAIMVQRLKGHFAILDQAAARHPSLFAPHGILAPYLCALMRWSVLYPVGQTPWFHLTDYPILHTLAKQVEDQPFAQKVAEDEGLGPTPFTAPRYAQPKVGSAT